jgi:uncharacterized membrane protein YoaK (UPF0700 family)
MATELTPAASAVGLTNVVAPQDFMVPARRVLCLGLVAGYVDALGFLDLNGIYTAAMTGNTVQLGVTFAQAQWPHFLLVAGTLGAFFVGGVISSIIKRHLPKPAMELVIMAGLLLAAQVVRLVHPGLVPVELPLLAISMAMQGETVSRFGGLSIQTIVVTNNILKFADGLVGRYVSWHRQTPGSKSDRANLGEVVVPGTAWFSYIAGAAGCALAVTAFRLPLLLPAAVLVLTACDLLLTGNGRKVPA